MCKNASFDLKTFLAKPTMKSFKQAHLGPTCAVFQKKLTQSFSTLK